MDTAAIHLNLAIWEERASEDPMLLKPRLLHPSPIIANLLKAQHHHCSKTLQSYQSDQTPDMLVFELILPGTIPYHLLLLGDLVVRVLPSIKYQATVSTTVFCIPGLCGHEDFICLIHTVIPIGTHHCRCQCVAEVT